jgi:hypothetical protein
LDRAASLVAAFDDARGAIDGLRPAGAASDEATVKRRGPRLKQTARRKSSGPPALKNGDRVEADFDGGGDYHSGKVKRARSDGTSDIWCEDGDKGTKKVKFTGLTQTLGQL